MRKKIIYLAIIYVLVLIIEGCTCPEVLPYFDFKLVDYTYPSGMEIQAQDTFQLFIYKVPIYLSSTSGLGFHSIALATSCKSDGHRGLKYPVLKYEIISDADWDDKHPAGVSLNDVAWFGGTHLRGKSNPKVIFSDYPTSEYYEMSETQESMILVFPKPLLNKKHNFTLKITKSNGQTVQASTEQIEWLE